MIQITAENKYNQSVSLTGNPSLTLAPVRGLTPPPANINTTPLATKDGSIFNSSAMQNRNIVLTLYPRQEVEATRVNLYKYFRVKQYIKLYITTSLRSVWIDGYIETMDGDLYENPQKMQISIICPDPYFKDTEQTVVSISDGTGSIENDSDDETGVVIELNATGAVSTPTITNETTGETFTINTAMAEGDKIVLNTRRGEKSLTKIAADETTTNIINAMDPGSDWFNLIPGENTFSYSAAAGAENLTIQLILQPIFEGV